MPGGLEEQTADTFSSRADRIKEHKDSSKNEFDFLTKVYGVFLGALGTFVCTVGCGIGTCIPVAAIVIGSVYLNDCTVEPHIPIYLIVAGVFTLISGYVSSVDKEKYPLLVWLASLFGLFTFGWFIAGNIWVYGNAWPHTDTDVTDPMYCHRTLYMFAFWLLTATYIMLGVGIFLACCVGICVTIIGITAGDKKNSNYDLSI
jgi:hypothetical protein